MAIERGPAQPAALRELTTTAIANTVGVNATEVFVYDTRKDSDGGAWRKRCQHTSWYNETLNTATRGARRDFPAVAVIVVTTTTVTLYDGDDPDLPMWMVFNAGNTTNFWASGSGYATASALNGIMYVGGAGGMRGAHFVRDAMSVGYTPSSGLFKQPGGVANRNDTYTSWDLLDRYYIVLGAAAVNDIAMTVLPNAPIDVNTGLPVPTVAISSPAGITVARNDFTSVSWFGAGALSKVKLSGNYMYTTYTGNGRVYVDLIPWAPVVFGGSVSATVARHYRNSENGVEGWANDGNALFYKGPITAATSLVPFRQNGLAVASSLGLSFIDENPLAPSYGMVAYATTKYNTGWMQGNIKGAWLADNTAETVIGSGELITNGTFDANVTGWTAYNSTIALSGTTMQVTRAGGTGPAAYQTITCVPGKTYTIGATINSSGSRGDLIVYSSLASGGVLVLQGTSAQTVNVTGSFVATQTTYWVQFAIDSNATSIYVDNVTCRLGEADRSATNKGLQVFGTITKAAVATGSDVVGYSGWSGSNHMIQPTNTSLLFGTGDYCIMAWFKTGLSGIYNEICDLAQVGSNDGRLEFLVQQSGAVYLYGGTGSVQVTGGTVIANTWNHCCAVRRNGIVTVYLNGIPVGSGLSNNNHNNTNAKLHVGINYNGGNSTATDQIALFRISATSATDEQILKSYNDEKQLFQAGAKACLYGSSDAVTAITYDDSTDLLHVGTSAGRSVFDGLRRVENTTTAVSTTISASNGLVVEQ